jgi:hypothetical protein
MGTNAAPHIDEMVFHTSSTRYQAEQYLKRCIVAPYSWWKLRQYVVDGDFEADEACAPLYYTHTRKAVPSPPFKRALAAYQRRKIPDHRPH